MHVSVKVFHLNCCIEILPGFVCVIWQVAYLCMLAGLRFQARNLILKTRTVETIEMIKKEATPDEPDDDSVRFYWH